MLACNCYNNSGCIRYVDINKCELLIKNKV